MADEINTQSDVQVTLATVVQAIQNNTTAVTHAANIIATGTDAQKKKLAGKAEDVLTTPGLTEKAVSKALVSLVNDVHSKLKKSSSSRGTSRSSGILNTMMSKLSTQLNVLNENLTSLYTGVKSQVKVTEEISSRQKVSTQLDLGGKYSTGFRKSLAKYPGYKKIAPIGVKSMGEVAAWGDFFRGVTGMFSAKSVPFKFFSKIHKSLGNIGEFKPGLLSNVFGMTLSTVLAITAKESVRFIKQNIMHAYKSTYSGIGLEVLTGRSVSYIGQSSVLSRAALMGYDRDTTIERQREFAQAGITNQEQFLSGLAAEKAYGVTNVAQYYQMLTRRTDAVSRYGNDLAKTFARLVPIAKNVGMGVSEMQQQVVSFTDSIKGGGFKDSAVQSMLSTYSGLIKTRELSAQEVASLYNRTQTLDFGKHMTATLFAQRGGYNFSSDNLLGQAYELRRLQGGDLASKGRLASAQLRGVLSNFGVSSFSQLPDSQKMMFLENILPQTLGIDVGRLPSADKIIGMLERGADITKMGGSLQSELENAQRKSTEDIVRGLDALQNPVNHIREYMLSYFTGGREGFKKYLEDQKSRDANGTKPQPIQLTAYIDQKMKDDLDIKFGVPGQPVKTAPIRR